jgi:hypothetical protein
MSGFAVVAPHHSGRPGVYSALTSGQPSAAEALNVLRQPPEGSTGATGYFLAALEYECDGYRVLGWHAVIAEPGVYVAIDEQAPDAPETITISF